MTCCRSAVASRSAAGRVADRHRRDAVVGRSVVGRRRRGPSVRRGAARDARSTLGACSQELGRRRVLLRYRPAAGQLLPVPRPCRQRARAQPTVRRLQDRRLPKNRSESLSHFSFSDNFSSPGGHMPPAKSPPFRGVGVTGPTSNSWLLRAT